MISIQNFQHEHLTIDNWQWSNNETWCVLGRNGSGKQYLNQLLTGNLTVKNIPSFKCPSPDKVSLISFESQQHIYELTLDKVAPDYVAIDDEAISAKNFLPQEKWQDPLISAFGLSHRMDTSYLQLSTGESRKLLILQAIFQGVELLICDNPFDSLDKASCITLTDALGRLARNGINVLLMLNNRQDIPRWCENVAFIERGILTVIGRLIDENTKQQLDQLLAPAPENKQWPETLKSLNDYPHPYLVKLIDGKVSFGETLVFNQLNVSIAPLQHTLITGANGSGKSTLMQLITGDCPQCYSNNINVLGYQRGSGESIWELKAQMGIVSAEIHRQYRISVDLLSVVLSGFYDSIGLYEQPSKQQISIALQWLDKIDMLDKKTTSFQQLSYGEQRLALIARALVKSPYLLILDEPTQGLDELNRHRILNFLTHLASQKHSTLLLVSHREDEFLPIFNQHIKL